MGHEHIRPTRTGAWGITVPTGMAKMEIQMYTTHADRSGQGNGPCSAIDEPGMMDVRPDFRFGYGTLTHPSSRHALIVAGSA